MLQTLQMNSYTFWSLYKRKNLKTFNYKREKSTICFFSLKHKADSIKVFADFSVIYLFLIYDIF